MSVLYLLRERRENTKIILRNNYMSVMITGSDYLKGRNFGGFVKNPPKSAKLICHEKGREETLGVRFRRTSTRY